MSASIQTHVAMLETVAGWLQRRTGNRVVLGSNPAGGLCFGTLAIPFSPLCQCLSDDTLKAVGPFYLVSVPGEVKIPHRVQMCNLSWTPHHF